MACERHHAVLELAAFSEGFMPAQCAVCGKQRRVANNVSHSNIKTKSIQRPNLRRVHVKVDGSNTHVRVCSRCLRSGRVVKVAS
jgi:large subunit ribosomal protein L28